MPPLSPTSKQSHSAISRVNFRKAKLEKEMAEKANEFSALNSRVQKTNSVSQNKENISQIVKLSKEAKKAASTNRKVTLK